MLKKTAIGFAAVSLTLAAAAFSPAFANYASCTENPEGNGCPGSLSPAPTGSQGSKLHVAPKGAVHAHNHQKPSQPIPQKG
jgi:hypothetical protein